jgi:hypothetical protein
MTLQEMFEDAGLRCRSYSGRGMYGERCLGVESENVGELLCAVAVGGAAAVEHAHTLSKAHQDSMGRGMIIYFPDVPFVGAERDDSDDE